MHWKKDPNQSYVLQHGAPRPNLDLDYEVEGYSLISVHPESF